ncbi:MAG: rhombosortase [Steroidobacteraceae bacterium]|nr:rhombosortase [Pseudomonadota bacterium]MBP6105489.1 rhombosortase [Steroidobacteraceae bacterium]MBP7013562.1 rhombosortase [Steroidobacteraceae bacterium]
MKLGRLPQLLQLAQLGARAWRAPLALALVLVAVQLLGALGRENLPYDRVAILAGGEYSRLVTAHFFHYDLAHLVWNLVGLALVAALFAREFDLRGWIAILVASTVAVDLGFLVFEPQIEWYVGFSGVLHGLMAAGLCAWLRRTPDAITALVAGLFALKLGWEHLVGPLPFTASTLAVPVIHQAHTYGAIGGAAAAVWILWRQRSAAASL